MMEDPLFQEVGQYNDNGIQYFELVGSELHPTNTLTNRRGISALHNAVSKGSEDIVVQLLQAGTDDVHAGDHLGNTPLHYCGHKEVAIILIEWGADPLSRNHRGDTPVDLMRRRGVESQAISYLTETIQDMEHSSEDVSEPLLPKTHKIMKRPCVKYVKSLCVEFCMEIGLKRFLILIFIVLLLSLYFALIITGFTKEQETRIPIVDGEHKAEL